MHFLTEILEDIGLDLLMLMPVQVAFYDVITIPHFIFDWQAKRLVFFLCNRGWFPAAATLFSHLLDS